MRKSKDGAHLVRQSWALPARPKEVEAMVARPGECCRLESPSAWCRPTTPADLTRLCEGSTPRDNRTGQGRVFDLTQLIQRRKAPLP